MVDGKTWGALGVGPNEWAAESGRKYRFMMRTYSPKCINANRLGPRAGGASVDDRVDRGALSGTGRYRTHNQQTEGNLRLRDDQIAFLDRNHGAAMITLDDEGKPHAVRMGVTGLAIR